MKSLRNWEFNLAAGCLAEVINQIALDVKRLKEKYGEKIKLQITLVTDHGNGYGCDHLVKMICWSSRDENGNHCIQHFNLDIDRGGHTAKGASAAIYHSLKALCIDDCGAMFSWICGDLGGGAKVQSLWPELVDLELMPELSNFVNCILHAFNLSYETACKDSLGEPGMNRCNTFQMCFLAILLLITIKRGTSLETLKKYYSIMMTKLLKDKKYEAAAKENFVQAFDKVMQVVEESVEDITGEASREQMEDIINRDSATTTRQTSSSAAAAATAEEEKATTEAENKEAVMQRVIEDLAAMCPTNIKEPNFGRWGTISFVAKIVLDHWLPLFYMAQNVRHDKNVKNGCYLHIIASKLIELMSTKSDPNQKTPTHYASLQWIVDFGEAMFNSNMEWAKRNDPVFGEGSYGHISRLMPEHIFVMERQLEEMKNGGRKEMKEFAGFIKSVNGISKMDKREKAAKNSLNGCPISSWRDSSSSSKCIQGNGCTRKPFQSSSPAIHQLQKHTSAGYSRRTRTLQKPLDSLIQQGWQRRKQWLTIR
jgi:hypothetical protein